jgi:serine protease Do
MKRFGLVCFVLAAVGMASAGLAEPKQPGAGDFRQVVQQAKDKVFPAVVFIKSYKETHEAGKRTTSEVLGSGVLISDDGQVLTNWHVVDKGKTIRCLLYDGSAYHAEILGTDKDTDLALLQLHKKGDKTAKPSNLPYAELGDSSVLREGDFVMAMGAPWGLNRSVSIGIISCTRRFLPNSSEYSLWLQTDADINPGNSGGPLVDTAGRVIGINTRGGSSLGFATPSNNIKIILKQLREHGKVNWSWTGLQLQPLRDFDRDIYFEGDKGVIVAETDLESPARRAGIQVRDRILRVNDTELNAISDENLPAVRRTLGLLPKNKEAVFTLLRDGKEMTITLTPRAKGKVEGEELDCPRWDMTVKAINQFDNEDLYFYRKKGVFIYGIKRPGNARDARLRPKDILLKIGKTEINTLDDVEKAYDQAIKTIDENHRIVITVLRNGLRQQFVMDFSRDYEKE